MRAAPWIVPAALALLVLGAPPRADAADPIESAVMQARRASDSAVLEAQRARIFEAASARPDSYAAQLASAELLLSFADELRNERKIRSDLDGDLNDSYRAQQADWARRAVPVAERARDLAADDAERAQAERVLGELYAHQITGMISGFVNGPRARRHIGRALELAPDDPECNRAIGLMYLHNPPISGGDVPRAIETFERCSELLQDDRSWCCSPWRSARTVTSMRRERRRRPRWSATRTASTQS